MSLDDWLDDLNNNFTSSSANEMKTPDITFDSISKFAEELNHNRPSSYFKVFKKQEINYLLEEFCINKSGLNGLGGLIVDELYNDHCMVYTECYTNYARMYKASRNTKFKP